MIKLKRKNLIALISMGVVVLFLKSSIYSGRMRYVFYESTFNNHGFFIDGVKHYSGKIGNIGKDSVRDIPWNISYLSGDKNQIFVDGIYFKYINVVLVRSVEIKKPIFEIHCLEESCMESQIRLKKADD